jgi:phosphomannomutase/phosphoglucomutase
MHVPHQLVRDGGMKVALTLYMLAERRESLSQLASRLPKYFTIKEKVPATRDEALCAVKAISEEFKEYRLITIDGVKVLGDDFWILVRPSGTEPVVRIMLEASTEEKARELRNKVIRIIAERCRS